MVDRNGYEVAVATTRRMTGSVTAAVVAVQVRRLVRERVTPSLPLSLPSRQQPQPKPSLPPAFSFLEGTKVLRSGARERVVVALSPA